MTISQETALVKAGVLAEALPWLLKFQNCIVVIKFGGNAMVNEQLLSQFAQDVVFLKLAGLKPVVVHGAGPQITDALNQSGIESVFTNGYRVTDDKSIVIIKKVLKNVQNQLVENINKLKPIAIGVSGDEDNVIRAEKKSLIQDGLEMDLGLVGQISDIDAKKIIDMLEKNCIPVISCLGIDKSGKVLNINADEGASAMAKFLGAQKFVLLTDVVGLLENYPDEKSLIQTISAQDLQKIIPNLDKGMRPKMEACLDAVINGVSRAHVIDGRKSHALLVEVFTDSGTGTMVVKD
ncbi:MAG: acetylglutamate kinase [Actinobacteria bacterium]|jgi:acetylglutamate kinase|nr:acetylglutamate kinase [Actinomycetota bacterium]